MWGLCHNAPQPSPDDLGRGCGGRCVRYGPDGGLICSCAALAARARPTAAPAVLALPFEEVV